ncbi:HesA/MoeB/ThiF family protein [Aquiflexum gelatinilyticum]|uniref:HesA/MoeB/ThiF family protein n=1 Tax=Aquiflexum gelatinilyticum TaxID=2961943 RepID=UPI00216993C1|nr:HesA/MoeB/ThiF family protein [Aquiflexum gelatinilyticum]MCS4433441.1 HesA/MoeB/ThiF family protein [Aquiflexum gelatinilyticum]
MDRFERQHILPGFGKAAQEKLLQAKVLVIGAGGLGCPALLYLAAAGVGKIGIIDGDLVSMSNLNRQVLFGEGDLGLNKAETSAHFLKSKYSDIKIKCIPEFISTDNIRAILSQFDLVIDGSDNFPTRYLVNDACVLMDKPLVFGAVYQNEGQVAILNGKGQGSINYRDIFPDPPTAYEIPNCYETGVLGVLPGIIGTLQAAEAIKFITGYGDTLVGKMLFYNLLSHQSYTMELSKNPDSKKGIPSSMEALEATDYAVVCGDGDSIDWEEAFTLLGKSKNGTLIDVREADEIPKLKGYQYQSVPLDLLDEKHQEWINSELILLFCQSGVRSLKAVKMLEKYFPGKKIHSISGGIEAPDSPIYK